MLRTNNKIQRQREVKLFCKCGILQQVTSRVHSCIARVTTSFLQPGIFIVMFSALHPLDITRQTRCRNPHEQICFFYCHSFATPHEQICFFFCHSFAYKWLRCERNSVFVFGLILLRSDCVIGSVSSYPDLHNFMYLSFRNLIVQSYFHLGKSTNKNIVCIFCYI